MKVVLAESFERIHRSNLLGMGVLPLEFLAGRGPERLVVRLHGVLAAEHADEATGIGVVDDRDAANPEHGHALERCGDRHGRRHGRLGSP